MVLIRKLYVYKDDEYDIIELTSTWDNLCANKADLIGSLIFMHEEGNYGCDCNRSLDIGRTYRGFPDLPCSIDNSIRLAKMWLNGEIIYEEKEGQ